MTRAQTPRAGQNDPLLKALIWKLPRVGEAWPRGDRVAWLELMARAFDVVYGREDAIDVRSFLTLHGGPAGGGMTDAVMTAAASRAPSAEPRYYIAADGRALRDPGAVPVKATEIPSSEVVWDERKGARDLDTIQWADGTWPAAALPPLSFAG